METQKIKLGPQQMKLYGFVCFFDPQGFKLRGEDNRRVRLSLKKSAAQEEIIEIDNADQPLIPLSRERGARLAGQEPFRVVSGDDDGGEAVYLLSARTGWNQTRTFLQKLIASESNALFMARYLVAGNEVYLGSGDVFRADETLFWIGMVLVHPEVQKQGIARRLLQTCLEYSYNENRNAVVGLDATPMGKPLYKRLGFRDSFNIWLCTLPLKRHSFDLKGELNIEKISHGSRLQAYLDERLVSGKGGQTALLQSLGDDGCFLALKRGRVVGVVFSRPGRIKPHVGPLIADSPLIAAALLQKVCDHWLKRGEHSLFMMIPEQHFNETGQGSCREWEFCLPFRVTCERILTRMYHIPAEGESHIQKIENYMEREQREVLPTLFAIGGAEIS
ncbi:MAG TPA: GNAT family N-acetyltransferase [Caldithrix abyssi]|uniref:GNAT family N-acetyltransferase n=1 Tax=Caldithrix abyssi TaxID=187145 RepID=A0A7V1PVZ4_CALAY|nr:GNAT family N-acetyltransferase [Caldithrix abyssi]